MTKLSIPCKSVDPKAPRLSWSGRRDGDLEVEVMEPLLVEEWGEEERRGRLILGDNLAAMAALEPGSVRLAYLDPPFFSEKRYSYRVKTIGGWYEAPSFDDSWKGKLGNYLCFLEDRLWALSRVLADDGSVYVHLDASAAHYVKVLLDEILGAGCFSRQIVWKIGWVSGFKSTARNWIRNHDLILYYARPGAPFNRRLLPHPEGYVRRSGKAGEGRPIDDVWLDIPSIQLKSFSCEKTGWATQKNEELLSRIIEASSEPGDLVLDPFCGAGTTTVVAASSGRRFVGIDESELALHLSRRRLLDLGACFTMEGRAPSIRGEVRAKVEESLAGPIVRLLDVPDAAGPQGSDWRERVDGWWVCRDGAPTAPLWQAHRGAGKRPVLVETTSPPLPGISRGEGILVRAVDLAGGLHSAKLGRGR